MAHFSRISLPLFASLLVVASQYLTSCRPVPYASFQPSHTPTVARTVRATPEVLPVPAKPAADLSASSGELLTRPTSAPTAPVSIETNRAVPAASAAKRLTKRPTVAQRIRALRRGTLAPCDQIVLRNGDVIEAKVKEVGVNEIRYKKCDRPDGPDYTIAKRDILSIKYSNGEVERYNASGAAPSQSSNRQTNDRPSNAANTSDGPRTDGFAIVSIASGAVAFFALGGAFLLGAAAVVFGALSLSRIRKNPDRFKGRGLAIAGMVLGIVAVGFIILYLYVL